MASALCDYSRTPLSSDYQHTFCRLSKTEENLADILPVSEIPIFSSSTQSNIPAPPPLPRSNIPKRRYKERSSECCCITKETRDLWDKLFEEGDAADVHLITEDKTIVPAHFCVLVTALRIYVFLFNCDHISSS